MIELKVVTKHYGSVPAVQELSFRGESGRITGIIGPNGAGKTTTIRMIMNIIAPDSGTILFDGRPLTDDDMEHIGYLPEERGLYRKEKVNDLLLYLGQLKGRDVKTLDAAIDHWLALFDLSEWKERKVEELSKGMAQKVQFISSVIHDPDIIILDEPFSGLDPVSTDRMRELIMDLSAQGKTILFSTHIMEQAEKLCDTILLLNKGKAILNGPIQEIRKSAGKNSLIIEFSGDASFIRDLPQVEKMIEYPQYLEILLTENADTDALFASLAGKLSIRRYELSSPSLHSLFVSRVSEKESEDA